MRKEDFKKRLEIEGVFSVVKTKYGWDKIMTKLPESQIASIGLVFFMMNLKQLISFTPFSDMLEMYVFQVEINQTYHFFKEEKALFRFNP